MDIREDPEAVLDERLEPLGPHPVQRAVVALLLGVLLGAVAALLQPRRRESGGHD